MCRNSDVRYGHTFYYRVVHTYRHADMCVGCVVCPAAFPGHVHLLWPGCCGRHDVTHYAGQTHFRKVRLARMAGAGVGRGVRDIIVGSRRAVLTAYPNADWLQQWLTSEPQLLEGMGSV